MGEKLIQLISEATGLPRELIETEINQLIASHGFSPNQITLEELRSIIAEYMQDVLCQAKDHLAQSQG